jgi:signal transduction histidine kinase
VGKHITLISLLSTFFFTAPAQDADTAKLFTVYDRAVMFDESRLDSLAYYAAYIEKQSKQLNYAAGRHMSLRLKGIYHNLRGEYSRAVENFIAAQKASEEINDLSHEVLILSDLATLYGNINQYELSKQYSRRCIDICLQTGDSMLLCNEYNNLGVTYAELKMPDSAVYMYRLALNIARAVKDQAMIMTLNNNIGDVSLIRKKWDEAIGFFRQNLQYDIKAGEKGNVFTDYFNLAEAFIGKMDADSAKHYTAKAKELLPFVQSNKNTSDYYGLMARFYRQFGNNREAYEALEKKLAIDTAIVNEATNKAVMELQEKYRAEKRENENKLLSAEVDKQKLRTRNITILAIGSVIVAALIAVSLYQNYQKNKKLQAQNEMIIRQNDKLAELNYEKNTLISVVSHDLSGPFANIKMWNQLLKMDESNLTAEQKKALQRMQAAAEQGEQMIRNILSVEKAETSRNKINFENFDLTVYIEEIVRNYKLSAAGKNISLHYESGGKEIYLLSDKQLVSRICENLLSNAIKYTSSGKNIWVSLSQENDAVRIQVRDEGVGINREELPRLFSKYSHISSKPTAGEASTGLGLSIVKRIVEELNGKIFCESEPGKGSLFTVVLQQ